MPKLPVLAWSARGDSNLVTRPFVLAMCLFALAARAEPSPPRIEIFLVGALGQDQTLAQRVTSRFDPKSFRVRATFVPKLQVDRVLQPDAELLFQAWAVPIDAAHARLYFALVEPRAKRTVYLLRDLQLDNGLDEIGAERIAEVLYLSALALIEGQAESRREEIEDTLARDASTLERVPAPNHEPTSPTDQRQPARPAKASSRSDGAGRAESETRRRQVAARWHLFYGLGYGGSFRGDEGLWHGPRASLHVALGTLGAAVVVDGGFSNGHSLGPITVRTTSVSAAALVEAQHAFTPAFSGAGFLGPGVDVVEYTPEQSTESDVAVGQGATEARPKIVLGAAAVFGRSSPRVALVAAASLAMTRTHYDVVQDGQNRVVGRPWIVFPSAGLDVLF